MNNLEQKMVAALRAGENWHDTNTSVLVDKDGTRHVYLFHNKIVDITADEITFNLCGWWSRTTCSRMTAVLQGLVDKHIKVSLAQDNFCIKGAAGKYNLTGGASFYYNNRVIKYMED